MSRERNAAVDVLRGIACAAVVMRHLSGRLLDPSSLAAPGGNLLVAAHLGSGFGVPLFLTLSAFSLAWKHSTPLGGLRGSLGFLVWRATRLLPAYVVWSLVSLAARDLALLGDPRVVLSSLLDGTADVQLYFVPLVFELSIWWPLLRPLLVQRSTLASLAVLSAGAFVGDLACRHVIMPTWTVLSCFSASVAAGTVLHHFAFGASRRREPFFPLSLHGAEALAAPALLLATAALIAGMTKDYVTVLSGTQSSEAMYLVGTVLARGPVAYALVVTALLSLVTGSIARSRLGVALAAIGRASYGIFFVHLLVASTIVYHVVDVDGTAASAAGALGRLVAAWALTLAVAYAVAALLGRFDGTAWLVGERPIAALRAYGSVFRGLLGGPVARAGDDEAGPSPGTRSSGTA